MGEWEAEATCKFENPPGEENADEVDPATAVAMLHDLTKKNEDGKEGCTLSEGFLSIYEAFAQKVLIGSVLYTWTRPHHKQQGHVGAYASGLDCGRLPGVGIDSNLMASLMTPFVRIFDEDAKDSDKMLAALLVICMHNRSLMLSDPAVPSLDMQRFEWELLERREDEWRASESPIALFRIGACHRIRPVYVCIFVGTCCAQGSAIGHTHVRSIVHVRVRARRFLLCTVRRPCATGPNRGGAPGKPEACASH